MHQLLTWLNFILWCRCWNMLHIIFQKHSNKNNITTLQKLWYKFATFPSVSITHLCEERQKENRKKKKKREAKILYLYTAKIFFYKMVKRLISCAVGSVHLALLDKKLHIQDWPLLFLMLQELWQGNAMKTLYGFQLCLFAGFLDHQLLFWEHIDNLRVG